MTVLFVTQYSEFLGANRSLLQVANDLKKKYGINVCVLLPSIGEMSDVLDANAIPYQLIKMYSSVYLGKNNVFVNVYRRIKGLLCELLNLYNAYYYSRNITIIPNIVHTNTSTTNIGAYIAYFLKVKHVWHIREFATCHYGYRYPLGRFQYKLMNRLSDKVITISKALSDFYNSYINTNKLKIVYNGLDFNEISYVEKPTEFNVVTVGLVHPSKHQEEIVQAWGDFLKLSGGKGKLYVVGGVDPCHKNYGESLMDYVIKNGIGGNVVFTGYQHDVQKYYHIAKVGILASTHEAFGRVTVEYMINRLVPVVKNSGANPEIVDNEKNGFVYDSKDEIVKMLYRLYSEKGLYETMSEAAYSKAINNYSLDNCINRIFALYQES